MFHHTNKYYEPSEVIPRANWGRVVRGLQPWHNLWPREELWESVRLEVNPALPSRLNCVFAYDDLNTANQGRTPDHLGFVPWLYEVEPVDTGAPQHRGDLHYFEMYRQTVNAGAADMQTATRALARGYWLGQRVSTSAEVLLSTDLRVTRVIDRGHPLGVGSGSPPP